MKRLLALNIVGLVVAVAMAGLLWQSTSSARADKARQDSLIAVNRTAIEIGTDMILMSDAMRGFLLDPTKQDEWQHKMDADDALSAAVDSLGKITQDAKYLDLAKQVSDMDEQKLNPVENKVLELAKTDREAAAKMYFSDYLPIRQQEMALVKQLEQAASDAADADGKDFMSRLSFMNTVAICAGIGVLLVMGGCTVVAARTTFRLTSRIKEAAIAMGEGIDRAADAAGQMSAVAQSLSNGASQQAASLEETSASMEEMAAMTRTNADSTRQAVDPPVGFVDVST